MLQGVQYPVEMILDFAVVSPKEIGCIVSHDSLP
jgi:hypothetical protein